MKSLERVRLSFNAGREGIRVEVWSESGNLREAHFELSGEDCGSLAAQLILVAGVSGAVEDMDVVGQILGRLLIIGDDLHYGHGLMLRADALEEDGAVRDQAAEDMGVGPTAGYSSPEACTRSGATYRQIDHWARVGALVPSLVSAGGSGTVRRYSDEDVTALRVLVHLRESGLSLEKASGIVARGRACGFRGSMSLDEATLIDFDGILGSRTQVEPDAPAEPEVAQAAPPGFEVFPNPDQAVRCTDCGRLCANRTGLAVHRRSAHPEKNSLEQGEPAGAGGAEPERPQPTWTEVAGDLRSRGWRCILCPLTGRGGGGWQKHWDAAHSDQQSDEEETLHRPEPEVDLAAEHERDERRAAADAIETAGDLSEEALAAEWSEQPEHVGKHRFTGVHRSVHEDMARAEKRIHCECGWVTVACETREDAREAFGSHRDEMEAARAKLAEVRSA